jgi:hypothetical protein
MLNKWKSVFDFNNSRNYRTSFMGNLVDISLDGLVPEFWDYLSRAIFPDSSDFEALITEPMVRVI